MKSLPFRLKIALLSACISGVVLVAFGVAAWVIISRQKLESVDTEIRSLGARHPGWIASRGNYERLDDALDFIFGDAHAEQVILLVTDADGTPLHTSPGWPADLNPDRLDCTLSDDVDALTVGTPPGRGRGGMGRGFGPGGRAAQATFTKVPRFETVTTATGEWRLGMLGTSNTTLVIGLNYAGPRAELDRIRNRFLLALPIGLFFVALGGWLVAGSALRPMQVIAETAERVTASGLDRRIPTSDADPEISGVIRVLNRMMDRLEASFRQATRFSADASHELKTPLTIMQGELEQALQAAPPGSSEQGTFSRLLEETQKLKTITRGLLLLAQADAGRLPLARQPVNLSSLIEELAEDALILASQRQLRIEVESFPGLTLDADRALLHTALFNLLTNAVKYNQPGGRVQIRTTPSKSDLLIEIGNSGPAIPPDEQARIFDRFHRADSSQRGSVEGMGLGLSLAREIIRAHGGELDLKQSEEGWTVFRLRLPRPLQPV